MTARPAAPHDAANADPQELGKFAELARRFWDPAGDSRALHLLNPVRTQFVRDRARIEEARLLDVGCGGGLLAESLTRAGARVTAIDLAPAMIAVARTHAAEQGLAIDYREQSAAALAATAAPYEVVTCMEMLEHVPDPPAMLRTLAELTRPGGHLFVSTIHRTLRAFLTAIVAAEYVLGVLPRGTHHYERLIRPAELARWGRAAGLSLREIAGLEVNPLTGRCTLTRDPSVNYLAHFVRAAGAPQICAAVAPADGA
ncbi:MAG TPA: bifunctional 2-polyprenyl-6-hydroxyphenol methylase/3-demethylubiquinol 3-O-methyltransferase UbiG [Steroidobacteraceae bacterium]|nr:bifunctional 2-polyprenyl-6-hydroxyphenol methylase/3-demethylubiquinol 3-O-methyltransferase UbiG [Steroidobacteraceae bacterium]